MIIQCKACNKSFNVPDNAIFAVAPAGTNGRNFLLKLLTKIIKEKQKKKISKKKISKKIKNKKNRKKNFPLFIQKNICKKNMEF